ncbi:MAG TPA: MlaE family lipid ABC transporter permease subunit [Stellaceae bacterium]|nr:MlaE family lipid ABC transporter permease subunit [Stellaceae bacterium]
MRGSGGWLEIAQGDEALVVQVGGRWLVAGAAELDRDLSRLDTLDAAKTVRIDLNAIEMLDTVGAWLVLRTCRRFEGRGVAASIENVPEAFAPLFDQVAKGAPPEPVPPPPPGLAEVVRAALEFVGVETFQFLAGARELLGFFGLVCTAVARAFREPHRLRTVSVVAQMQRAGVSALPIVGLLSFLIGVVLTFQGADQLRRFGAEIFAVDLLGLGVLRELGVLLTAIIVAGRSGSAFTAELGAMQVNEEVDALRTLGLDPVDILVLPRLFGLVLTLPLLTFYANFMALLGGALMTWVALGIPLNEFLRELHDAVSDWTFWLGVVKAPFFAASIAVVGCRRGLGVERSAESVGRSTTLSVVESIFLVIVIDAAFSILFAQLHI